MSEGVPSTALFFVIIRNIDGIARRERRDTMPMKPVGQTQASGFQVGVRKTLNISVQEAWELITSNHGVQAWLGDVPSLQIEKGHRFQTTDGVTGEISTINPHVNIRLSWRMAGWDKPSIVQVRTIASGMAKTTISFHHEKLDGPDTRETMKRYWEQALNRLIRLTP